MLELTIARPSLCQISSLRKWLPCLNIRSIITVLLTRPEYFFLMENWVGKATCPQCSHSLLALTTSTHILAGNEFSSLYSLTSFSAHSSRIPGNGYALFFSTWIRKLKADPLMLCSHAARFGGMMTFSLPISPWLRNLVFVPFACSAR